MDKSVREEYLINITETMLHNMDGTGGANVMLVKHYNAFDISNEEMAALIGDRDDIRLLYHSYETGDVITAFEPFIDWIRNAFYESRDESLDEFFEKSGVYLLHRPIFKSYFETGICRRKEAVLVNEIEFESDKFHEEIIGMLKHLAEKKPLMIILNKIQFAGSSTIALINRMLADGVCSDIAILATYNEIFSEVDYHKEEWKKMIERLEASDSILEWAYSTEISINENKSLFEFSYDRVEGYIIRINNLYNMLALEQAEYYLNNIYHKIEVEKVDMTPEHRFRFLEMYAYVAMCLDKHSDALLYCDGMRFILEECDDSYMNYSYNFLKAHINMYSTQKENAAVYVARCMDLCRKIKDPFLTFKTKMLALMNEFSGWRNLWLLMEDRQVDPEIIEDCKKYEHFNHLAHIYVYAFDNEPSKYSSIDTVDSMIPSYNMGIEIAVRLGNDRFLIDAYKKSVMSASANGFFEVSNHFYAKCQKVVERMGNTFEEANIYNGMGYNCSTMEKYSKAAEYFNRALLIFKNLGDINYISETLYNMAINAILAEEYTYADVYLTTCLKICRLIKSDGIRVCNLSKLYGLKALCSYEMNVIYSCRINFQYLERYLGHIIVLEESEKQRSKLWEDDLILYYLLASMLAQKDKDYGRAYDMIVKAGKYVTEKCGSLFLFIVPYTITYAEACRATGRYDEAEEAVEHAVRFCEERGYVHKKNKIKAYRNGNEYMPRRYDVGVKGITMEEILDMAVYNITRSDYVIQKSRMDFLSIWQKITNNTEDLMDKMIKNSVNALKNGYIIDEFLFIRMENGVPVVRYNDMQCDIDADKVNYLVEYFNVHRNAFCTTRLDKEFIEHNELITKIFGVNTISTWMCTPLFVNEKMSGLFIACMFMCSDWNHRIKRNAFTESDIGIMKLMFRQLMDAIERYESRSKIEKINNELHLVNERLKNLAVRDTLTGLYNRQGFTEELEKLITGAVSEQRKMEISILYADLDNFKYYNDEFGHDIGDFILVSFAEMLSRICGTEGYAVRYGGDEFIMVIYSVDRKKVESSAKEIYSILKAEKGFTERISEKLGRKVIIPEDRYVSCSIGISGTVILPEDSPKEKIDRTIKEADEMMYYIKKTVKHRYVFYDDIRK